jgi:hypothetical protein
MSTQPLSPEVPRIPPQSVVVASDFKAPEAGLLAMSRAPEVVLAEAAKAAQALRDVIERKPRKVVLNGKTYLQFEDWQILGRIYGVTAVGRSTSSVSFGKVQGFECHAEALLVSSDQVISRAEAMCLDDEPNWSGKPLYQLRSMAQTRACAKALRNVLAWVVVLAGYAPTPAEEMDSSGQAAVKPATNHTQERIAKMMAATTIDALSNVYKAAYREAIAANDQHAKDLYIQAKDARKRELQ